ncbi:bactofilin family protein [Natronomonas marina]|jgi:cytoskeletal protein CcmA (bactofilin family)|uniref:bactofilin family protein n=1 Tax=Natronomonas marina TaxID=2961939 RepID=UPI0020C9BE91|nr:polymer-forming cytoskeletal protein [Natronomonas marina]
MRRALAVVLGVVLVLSLFTGVTAADTRAGGTVVVDEGETVNGLSATAGTIVIEGTVDGDLRAYGGEVRIAESGEVTGIVRAYAGEVRIDGTVGGNVLAYAGSVRVGETATIDRSFGAVAGDVVLAGQIDGDANAFAGEITLARTATVGGDLTYEGELDDRGGTVDGVTQKTQDLALFPPAGPLSVVFSVFMFFANLLLGAILLYVGPRFADAAYETVLTEPLRTGGAGLAAVGGVALAVALLAITIVGLPLAVALLMLTVVLAWVAAVYGRYVVGQWLLSYTGRESRYLALFVGVVVVGLLGIVPYLGFAIRAVVFLIGAGVVALALLRLYELVTESRGGLSSI